MFLNFTKRFLTRFSGVYAVALPLILAAGMMAPAPARAEITLAMFEEHGCVWCEKWNKEIAPIYPKTNEGKIAPLVRYDVHNADYSALELKTQPYFTPTFVLLDDGKELSRIEGYPGEDFFWALLGMMIDKLPEDQKQIAPSEAAEMGDSATDTSTGTESAAAAVKATPEG